MTGSLKFRNLRVEPDALNRSLPKGEKIKEGKPVFTQGAETEQDLKPL